MKIKKILSLLFIFAFIPCIFLFTGCKTDKQIEIRVENDYVQWSYVGEDSWTNVISVDSIKDSLGVAYQGKAGVDGKQVEFRKTQDYIQWHYVGESSWQNLITISELKNSDSSSVDENPQGLAFYPLDDGTYGVGIGYATQLSHIEIPETYKGKTITTIVSDGFPDRETDNLCSITLPSTIKTMQKNAFSGCNYLESVNIKDLSSWLKIDFENEDSNPLYNDIAVLYVNGVKLEDLVVPSDIEEIKTYTFSYYKSLKTVTISNSVKKIDSQAFYFCDNLTNVVIANSVTEIESFAFANCSKLTNIVVPKSVEKIGEWAFSDENMAIYVESESIKSTWSENWNKVYGYDSKFIDYYLYSEKQPEVEGKFWHYVNGVVTKW